MALTDKQAKFVTEYLIDLNATQAAIRAGYSENTAFRIAAENMQKPAIQEAIADLQDARAKRTLITADRVLREIGRIAFFDVRKLFNDDGSPKNISEIDSDTAAAVQGVEVNVGEFGTSYKYKIADKNKALDSASKHIGITPPTQFEIKNSGSVDVRQIPVDPVEASKAYMDMVRGK